jgi:hypothetical protein
MNGKGPKHSIISACRKGNYSTGNTVLATELQMAPKEDN